MQSSFPPPERSPESSSAPLADPPVESREVVSVGSEPSHHPAGVPPMVRHHDPSAMPARRPGWIVPLGVVCICYASLGMLLAIFNAAVQFVLPWFLGWVIDQGDLDGEARREALEAALHTMAIYGVITALVTVAIGVVLLIGGIKLVRLRRSSRIWLTRWSVARLVFALIQGIMVIVLADTSVALVSAMQDPNFPVSETVLRIQAIGGGIFSLLFVSAAPVALLLILRRPAVKTALDELPDP